MKYGKQWKDYHFVHRAQSVSQILIFKGSCWQFFICMSKNWIKKTLQSITDYQQLYQHPSFTRATQFLSWRGLKLEENVLFSIQFLEKLFACVYYVIQSYSCLWVCYSLHHVSVYGPVGLHIDIFKFCVNLPACYNH